MVEYGITEEGFNRKRLDVLLEELNSQMKLVYGNNFNISINSPQGQVNGILSESNANIWEALELAYDSFNPSKSIGVQLSNLVQLNGLERLGATKSTAQLTLTGTSGVLIPLGSVVSSATSTSKFTTTEDVIIDGNGEATANSEAQDTGQVLAVAGTLTVIDTPVAGWDTVTNENDAQVGRDIETDIELRSRRDASTALRGIGYLDSMYASILNLTGVTQCSVLGNDTNATDINGLPPKSFSVVVSGGEDENIANTIWDQKCAGILPFGNTNYDIIDDQGKVRTINFTRPSNIPVYVIVNLTKNDDYPSDGDNIIKSNIVEYANGNLIAGRGFSVGDDVIQSRLYTPVNSVIGHDIINIFIGLAPIPTSNANIPIAIDEVSQFLEANITIVDV